MANLNQDLEILHELNKYRDRAKELRKQGLLPLKSIEDIYPVSIYNKVIIQRRKTNKVEFKFANWIASGNNVEIALLAKVQNHRDICEKEDDNNKAQATPYLKNRLSRTILYQFK